MTDVAIRTRGLRVDAPGGVRSILGPVDLEISRGEHVLVVGASGSGKTTLLRAIAGLARPAAGSVELFGTLASDAGRIVLRPEERDIGMLFQGGALWPHMSVARTVDFVLRHRGVPRSQRAERRAEVLELVDLAGFDGRKPATLSGGEAQRLALARALAASPRLLLLDEPLGPLDGPRRRELLDRLDGLQRKFRLTLVHVTHDPEEAGSVADRILSLDEGRLTSSHGLVDPPEEGSGA